MNNSSNTAGQNDQTTVDSSTDLSIDDLISSESEVLRRVAEVYSDRPSMAGHNSSTSGHNSAGSHTSHTSARVENPLKD